MASRPHNTTLSTKFHEIRTPTVTKHARIVEIGQHQIQKSMKLPQIEKRIQQTLTNSKDIIQKGRKSSRRRSRARSTHDQANEAWALYKSNPSRVFQVDLSRDRYIAFPTLVSPAGNTFAPRLLFTRSNLALFNEIPTQKGVNFTPSILLPLS